MSTDVIGSMPPRRLTHGHLAQIDGSHLFPLERPAETAAEVLRQIEPMRAQTLPA